MSDTIAIGTIAERVFMRITSKGTVSTIELTEEEAMKMLTRFAVAVSKVKTGATVKQTWGGFIREFSA